jgi:hypothetical protein
MSFVFVGILYIVEISFYLVGAFFAGAFTCWEGCNKLSPVYHQESILELGLLILAVIETAGLYKKREWARYFGIVLGISLMLPNLLASYTQNASSLLGIFNPFTILTAVAVIFLAKKSSVVWKKTKHSSFYAFLLSVLALALTGINIQNYHQVIKPFRQEIAQGEADKIHGSVKAGISYQNTEYGFELTFPVDEIIYYDMEGPTGKTIVFSKGGLHSNTAFSVQVQNIYDGQDTPEGIIRHALKTEPRDSAELVTINGIPLAHIAHWPNGKSFEYVTVHNGKLLHFANYGGLPASSFDPILQTLKFIGTSNTTKP